MPRGGRGFGHEPAVMVVLYGRRVVELGLVEEFVSVVVLWEGLRFFCGVRLLCLKEVTYDFECNCVRC